MEAALSFSIMDGDFYLSLFAFIFIFPFPGDRRLAGFEYLLFADGLLVLCIRSFRDIKQQLQFFYCILAERLILSPNTIGFLVQFSEGRQASLLEVIVISQVNVEMIETTEQIVDAWTLA